MKQYLGKILRKFFAHKKNGVRVYDLKMHERIKIHETCRISTDSRLDTSLGGSITVGANTELLNFVLLMTYGGNISIGDFCSINPFTIIYGHGNTKIGNYVMIAGNCMLIPNNHTFEKLETPMYLQPCTSKGIIIEDDVWIGANCTILDGVTIGKGSVVGAGSVVNKSIPSYSIAVGVPAKVIKTRTD